MVTVYNFQLYDTNKRATIIPPWKSTFKKIYENNGKLIPESAQLVDATQIYDGNYIPTPEGRDR
jgi:hypothetical protein